VILRPRPQILAEPRGLCGEDGWDSLGLVNFAGVTVTGRRKEAAVSSDEWKAR